MALVLGWMLAGPMSGVSGAEESAPIGLKTTVKNEISGATGDTSIVIKKGAVTTENPKDFEVVSGTDTVAGDPKPAQAEAFATWRTQCADWKKEFRENNHDNMVLSANCGDPQMSMEPSGLRQYKSTAKYKLRVRVRGQAQ